MRALFLLILVSAPLRALETSSPAFRLPRAAAGQVAFLQEAARQGAPELQGLDAGAPDFALAVAPLAEQLARGLELRSAKREGGLAAARLILDAALAARAGRGDPEEMRRFAAAAARWSWYGEPAQAALALLRDELAARRIQPLLQDPFDEKRPGAAL